MSYKREEITPEQIRRQREFLAAVAERSAALPEKPRAMVDTYGCQQNEADSERLRGMLLEMGYELTREAGEADVIVLNTCAVREHAEKRVFGNVGQLTHTKKAKPGQVIALCGCMVQQQTVAEKIKNSYRIVDRVFGPQALGRCPELLLQTLTGSGRVFAVEQEDGAIAEGLPQNRDDKTRAWLSVMYGCNNFCSYCIVPYVRGRERSRRPEEILREAEGLVRAGYKDITLLGQNVNSYGKDLDEDVDFSDIIRRINEIPGDFLIRFMTSHPKDAGEKLFRTMASVRRPPGTSTCPSRRETTRFRRMNRHYTKAQYLSLVDMARSYMPRSHHQRYHRGVSRRDLRAVSGHPGRDTHCAL